MSAEITEITYWRIPSNHVGLPDDRDDPLYRYAYRTEEAALDALEAWLRERLPTDVGLHHRPIGDFYTRTDFPAGPGKIEQDFRVRDYTVTRQEHVIYTHTRWESRWTRTHYEPVVGVIDGVEVAGKREVVTELRPWAPWRASWSKSADESRTGFGFSVAEKSIRLEWSP